MLAVLFCFLWNGMTAFVLYRYLTVSGTLSQILKSPWIWALQCNHCIKSDARWYADWFSACTELPWMSLTTWYVLLCALNWDMHYVAQRRPLQSKQCSHKFLHHYEPFRCSLLDVHIWEARGPSKSNIKYKWDLYEPIFIYSLLLHSV